MHLKEKVAIVTGGNTGIGKAIGLSLTEEGANIVVDYVARPETTEELERKVSGLGDQAIGVQADVSKVPDLKMLVESAVGTFGRVDVMLAPHNILVVGVGPGAVATAINVGTMKDPSKMKTLDAAIPLGRMAQRDEIGSVMAFLAGDGASYVTATTIFADGGIMRSSSGL